MCQELDELRNWVCRSASVPNYFYLMNYICDVYLCLCPRNGNKILTYNELVFHQNVTCTYWVKETKICFVLFVRFTGFRTVAVNWRCKACGCFSDPFQEGVIEVLYKLQHSDSDQSLQNRLNKTLSQNTVCSEDCVWNCWRFCHCVCVCVLCSCVCVNLVSCQEHLLCCMRRTSPVQKLHSWLWWFHTSHSCV